VTVIYAAQTEAPEKKTRGMLPLLVILFVISYSILTLLVVEQGRTIESQRTLLRELIKDSTELANLKGKLIHDKAARSQEKASPQAQNQDPATENPNARAGAGAEPHGSGKEPRQQGKSRSMKDVPQKPAADLQDVRRSTRVI
jgi:hypothetical protein